MSEYSRKAAAESLLEHLTTPNGKRRPLTREEVEFLFDLHLEGKEIPYDSVAAIELLKDEAGMLVRETSRPPPVAAHYG